MGNEKAIFSVKGTINRNDWGLNWNMPLETGGLLISDSIAIEVELQLVKQS